MNDETCAGENEQQQHGAFGHSDGSLLALQPDVVSRLRCGRVSACRTSRLAVSRAVSTTSWAAWSRDRAGTGDSDGDALRAACARSGKRSRSVPGGGADSPLALESPRHPNDSGRRPDNDSRHPGGRARVERAFFQAARRAARSESPVPAKRSRATDLLTSQRSVRYSFGVAKGPIAG